MEQADQSCRVTHVKVEEPAASHDAHSSSSRGPQHPASTGRDHALEALVARCHQMVQVFIISRFSGATQMGS